MTRARFRPLLLAAALAAAATAADAKRLDPPPLEAVPAFDVTRYAGTWHEIARLPMDQEKDCVRDITATYTLQSDGTIAVRNECSRADGTRDVATAVGRRAGRDPAKLEVRFAPNWLGWVPFVWADYWIIAVDDDYQWAIVGEPDRDYLWFLARTPTVEPAMLEALKGRARTLGYDVDALIVNPPPQQQ